MVIIFKTLPFDSALLYLFTAKKMTPYHYLRKYEI